MVVRFVRVIRVPACALVSRVSRVCPGSPRCLFTGTVRRRAERAAMEVLQVLYADNYQND